MPYLALANASSPVLTIFDRADPPGRALLSGAGPILELGAQGGGRNLWAARLDEAVRLAEEPVVLVAHGISCFAVAWWARLSPASYVTKVASALFVRPLGTGVSASPEQRFAGPRTLVPFPSLVIDEINGAADLARDWGSRFAAISGSLSFAELLALLQGPDETPAVVPAEPAMRTALEAR